MLAAPAGDEWRAFEAASGSPSFTCSISGEAGVLLLARCFGRPVDGWIVMSSSIIRSSTGGDSCFFGASRGGSTWVGAAPGAA